MNEKIQAFKYVISDFLSAVTAWVIFYIFRKAFLETGYSISSFNLEFTNNFYERVQNGFIKIFKKNPKKYMKIDSNKDINHNEKIILKKVNDLI